MEGTCPSLSRATPRHASPRLATPRHMPQAGSLGTWLSATSDLGGWYILWVTVRMSVIGPIFGIVLGVLSVRWLEANAGADRDANVEVICTLAMPFLVFYLAETAFGEAMQMSGVLAVVSYGLVFASPYGKVLGSLRPSRHTGPLSHAPKNT